MELPKIAEWTEGDLRRYVTNLILTDPGALPKSVVGPSASLPTRNLNDGDVPVWDSASNSWVSSTAHKVPITDLFGGYVLNRVVMATGATFAVTAGARALFIECVGGGGGGGGAILTAAGQNTCGAGGGGGAYSSTWLTTNVGAGTNLTIAVGAAGTAGTTGGSAGGAGGDTSFQNSLGTVVCLAKGGSGGGGDSVAFSAAGFPAAGGAGGAGSSGTGDTKLTGGGGEPSFIIAIGSFRAGSGGLNAGLPSAGGQGFNNTSSNGNAGTSGGGGGGGSNAVSQGTGKTGGAGGAGFIRVWEFF